MSAFQSAFINFVNEVRNIIVYVLPSSFVSLLYIIPVILICYGIITYAKKVLGD